MTHDHASPRHRAGRQRHGLRLVAIRPRHARHAVRLARPPAGLRARPGRRLPRAHLGAGPVRAARRPRVRRAARRRAGDPRHLRRRHGDPLDRAHRRARRRAAAARRGRGACDGGGPRSRRSRARRLDRPRPLRVARRAARRGRRDGETSVELPGWSRAGGDRVLRLPDGDYVTCGRSLVRVAPGGAVRWRVDSDSVGAPTVLGVAGELVVVAETGGLLRAHRASDGASVFAVPVGLVRSAGPCGDGSIPGAAGGRPGALARRADRRRAPHAGPRRPDPGDGNVARRPTGARARRLARPQEQGRRGRPGRGPSPLHLHGELRAGAGGGDEGRPLDYRRRGRGPGRRRHGRDGEDPRQARDGARARRRRWRRGVRVGGQGPGRGRDGSRQTALRRAVPGAGRARAVGARRLARDCRRSRRAGGLGRHGRVPRGMESRRPSSSRRSSPRPGRSSTRRATRTSWSTVATSSG